ncbi:MAG: tyrosine-type recombinase/integrase [Candidatus Cloacimonetes bacterium]|nr:tyrosine-type recombinase/integrase [Candidatus Cloacimonadota bacterium]
MKHAVLWAENKMQKDLKRKSIKQKITLNEFASEFFTSKDPHNFRLRNEKRNRRYFDDYYYRHQGRLNNYIFPQFGQYLMESISDVMIEDWLLTLKSYRNPAKDLADDSKNKILECMRMVFQEAKRQGYITNNPAREVQLINVEGESRKTFSELELFQMFPKNEEELLRIWQSRMWAVYFLIMRDTGFRPGEVAGLTLGSYNPQYKGIYTEQSIHHATRKVIKRIKTTGKGKNYKVGLLTNQTIEQLNKLIEEQDIKDRDGLLFLLEGRPLIPETANKHLKLSLRRTEVKLNGRTQYCLRHAFETALAGKVEEKVLLELMAHKSFRKEYDHRTPEDLFKQLQPAWEVIEKRTMMQ